MKVFSGVVAYFQGVGTEARKVVWPSSSTLLRNFLSVVVGVGLATAVIGGVDYVFIHLLSFVIK